MAIDPMFLRQRQSLPLEAKIAMSKSKIREALNKHDCYISFSGGRDSMVLMDLVLSVNPRVPIVFCDTGVEWQSVRESGLKHSTVVLKPSMPFKDVVKKYGYPAISKDVAQKLYEIRTTNSYTNLLGRLNGDKKGNGKLPAKYRFMLGASKVSHKCCEVMKKRPFKKYEKETGRIPFVGTMASDSSNRKMAYLKNGCNSFRGKRHLSSPLGFWMNQDILDYVDKMSLEVPEIYKSIDHTGCVGCLFGCVDSEYDKPAILKKEWPKMYKFMCKLGMQDIYDEIKHGLEKQKKKKKKKVK